MNKILTHRVPLVTLGLSAESSLAKPGDLIPGPDQIRRCTGDILF
jgi:hypothetical protein